MKSVAFLFFFLYILSCTRSSAQIGRGDSIGVTMSDYGSNGGTLKNLINYGDGTLALARMASATDDASDRGTYYSYSDDGGDTWTSLSWVEGTRQGWGNIDQFPAAGGTEVTVSHTGLMVCVDAEKGAQVWTCQAHGDESALFPRIAVSDPFNIHLVTAENNQPTQFLYSRSTNAGATWDILNQPILDLSPGHYYEDCYDVSTFGSTVAVVNAARADEEARAEGDIVYALSTNHGESWTEHLIYDEIGPGELPWGKKGFKSDGTVACIFDFQGNLHVVWCNMLATGDTANNPELFPWVDAPLRYWSEATGVVELIPTVHDTTIEPLSTQFGSMATQPDISVDSMNNVYITYQQYISEEDTAVQWDAAGQPSGVYFYRLEAGEFVETKRLLLVR